MRNVVPVIDLFAGPGGLGEGFSAYHPAGRKTRAFRIALSVEKDPFAHQTLLLRSFFRQFPEGEAPREYYKYLRCKIAKQEDLFRHHPVQAREARREAMWRALGEHNDEIHAAIEKRLKKHGGCPRVLIGGPPCQAYSVVGRSRMQGAVEVDARQVLYQEYLEIIARFRPAVFVMENVKGILSSRVKLDANARPHVDGKHERIFERILRDLKQPEKAVREADPHWSIPDDNEPSTYRVYSLVTTRGNPEMLLPEEFVIRAEDFGIPQTRHRVILLGVRDDIPGTPRTLTRANRLIPVEDVLGDFPPLRSQLSRRKAQARDSPEAWRQAIEEVLTADWLNDLAPLVAAEPALDLFDDKVTPDRTELLRKTICTAARQIQWEAGVGQPYMKRQNSAIYRNDWFYDRNMRGICNHESRSHMVSDLHRYLFLACYARIVGVSPTIRHFPAALLPDHENVRQTAPDEEMAFDDRFRVQVAHRPATTITSHISKDGHYNVHFDPTQCRSLTVREAARIQTFPDNYKFEGPRTEQYHQVGNAVPPLLAWQIAEIVYALLDGCDGTD